MHSVAIDYSRQTVFFSNNFLGQLQHASYIYNNSTQTFIDFHLDTKQVAITDTSLDVKGIKRFSPFRINL